MAKLVIFGYLWRAPVMIAGQLLAYPLAPIGAALADEDGRLPAWLQWLETHDQPGWDGPFSVEPTRELIYLGFRRLALTRWLWRNKAYRLASWLGVKIDNDEESPFNSTHIFSVRSSSEFVPPKWGPSFWHGSIEMNDGRIFWELQPRFSFGKFVIYARIGWKVLAYCKSAYYGWPVPKPQGQNGMFNAVSPRIKSLGNWK